MRNPDVEIPERRRWRLEPLEYVPRVGRPRYVAYKGRDGTR
jgi:hypothetical protein